MARLVIADIRSMNTDGKAVGHYFTVAENFVDMFKNCCEISVAGGPLYKQKFGNKLIHLKYDSFEQSSAIKNKIHIFQNMQQLFEECADDVIVLQCSAVVTAYMGIAFYKKPQTRLYMIQYNTMGIDSRIKRILYSYAKNKVDGVICPQNKIGEAYGRPYCTVPDYIYVGKKENRSILYENKKYDFGMVGIISRDKGIIEAAKRFKNTKHAVLIAGHPQNEEIRNELKSICSDAGNIDLRMEYLSESEYYKSIEESRYCVLNYSGAYTSHSSGVVFDIIFRGTPVIASDCKSMAFIKEFELGKIIDNIDSFEPEKVLNKEYYLKYCKNIQKYYETHKYYFKSLKRFLGLF